MLAGGLQNAFADVIPPRVIASDIFCLSAGNQYANEELGAG
jgi:hypothetical protein